jgi:nitronate monooxygenase
VPVVAAGGIADARGIIAAFALGAEGVQIGTAFLATEDAGASVNHRNALLSPTAQRTSLTKGFTGRLARGVHNQLIEELNRPGVEILPYPLQRQLVKNLAVPAEKAGRTELLQLWAGQSASLSRQSDAKTLLEILVSEISAVADPVVDCNREQRAKR